MLAKTARAQQPSGFRPIANIRLLYKTFAFMILDRIEALLEANQPEEQHGFRKHRRMDEHLLGQGLGQRISSVDCNSGFVKSFGEGELECIVACVT